MTTAFSFHCIVCFDEFNEAERHPVVLPCGHTYICAFCSVKLDKCTECRASLWTPSKPKGDTSATSISEATSGRPSWSRSNSVPLLDEDTQKKETPRERTRLPTPKNMVLLSLMYSTTIMETDIGMKRSTSNDSFDVLDLVESREQKQEESARLATELMASDCGTYTIVAREGLQIYPLEDAEVKHPTDKSMSMNTKSDSIHVNYGDQLQVVSIKDGWAKLARGYGRVTAGASNLVKVGCFKDKACGIEAMLHMSSMKRRNLHEEEKKLESTLHDSLLNDHDLTVAARDLVEGEDAIPPSLIEIGDETSCISEEFAVSFSTDCDDLGEVDCDRRISGEAPESSLGCVMKRAFACFAASESINNTITQVCEKRCTPSTPTRDGNGIAMASPSTPPRSVSNNSSFTRPSPISNRQRNTRVTQRHSPRVNFRTGLSGFR